MATSISIQENTVTTTSISVSFIVNVTYAGTYKIVYGITGDDGTNEEYTSSNFTLDAGGSTGKPYKKFTGLTPGTEYNIYCQLWNAETNKNLGITDSVYIYTDEDAAVFTVHYYDGGASKEVTSDTGGPITILSTGLRPHSPYVFYGWATKTSTNNVTYTGGEEVYQSDVGSSLNLYAVYRQEEEIIFYYGENKAYSNKRKKIKWRWNTSNTGVKSNNYELSPSYLPKFDSTTLTVGNLKYKVLGWRVDDVAGPEDYVGGYVPDSDEIWDLPSINYAVYSRTVTISYNSNGGSGSMSDSTGTAFYSSAGNKETANISLKNCTFTPPTGKQFNYWSLKSDGSGTQYTDSISTSYDSTMYAVWSGGGPAAWSWSGVVTFGGKDYSCPITSGGSVPVVKQSDGTYWVFYMNASEWNEFCTQINKLRQYHGLSNYSFTSATAGYPMKASQYNQAANALNGIQSGSVSTISAGATVTASHFKALATAFNNLR